MELIFCVVNNEGGKSIKLRGRDLKNKTKSIQKCCCSFVLRVNLSAKQYFVGFVQAGDAKLELAKINQIIKIFKLGHCSQSV